MTLHLYLMCGRFEALVASQLEPDAFGAYMATGSMRQTYGEVIFAELDIATVEPHFDLERARHEAVPHPDGSPKRSKYIAIYRVIERVPVAALKTLYLTTRDGRVLPLAPTPTDPNWEKPDGVNMYMELAPTTPLVVSTLGPASFIGLLSDPSSAVHVPRLMLADMLVDQDADGWLASYLPYRHPSHIRECILQVTEGGKTTKVVDRDPNMAAFYRAIRRGFFFGDRENVVHFPFPSRRELEEKHHLWWKSASMG